MTDVHLLYHVHLLDDEDDSKLIGVYSTRETAEAAVEQMRPMPGSQDWPDIITGLGDRENP